MFTRAEAIAIAQERWRQSGSSCECWVDIMVALGLLKLKEETPPPKGPVEVLDGLVLQSSPRARAREHKRQVQMPRAKGPPAAAAPPPPAPDFG
jgi:hypothetical protein